MEIRKAVLEDIDALVKNRIDFVQLIGNPPSSIPEDFAQRTKNYLMDHMKDEQTLVWVAVDNGVIVSDIMVCFYDTIPMISNLSGRCGYLLNVYTLPEYRRQGLASQLIRMIIQESKERNVGKLYLNATQMGRPVYQKMGFESLEDEMVYIIK